MNRLVLVMACLALLGNTTSLLAHKAEPADKALNAEVEYLGNEALLFSHAGSKVLFDPFFHNDYGSYQLVPESIRDAIFAGQKPYDNISMIVVSHAHGDHFAADDVANYLLKFPETILVAPDQAVAKVLDEGPELSKQVVSVALEFGDSAVANVVGNIAIESVRIPHAGWPQRKDVSNLVHRVTIQAKSGNKTIMHMGDADPDDLHFKPFDQHWQQRLSHAAFPPYWFFTSNDGPMILQSRINADAAVGVHVPIKVPEPLKQSKAKYFSQPGEKHNLD